MGKENIGSLQLALCNELWNCIRDELNKVRPRKKLLQCKNKMKNLKVSNCSPGKKMVFWCISEVFNKYILSNN